MNELDEEKRIRLTLQVRHNKTWEIQLGSWNVIDVTRQTCN